GSGDCQARTNGPVPKLVCVVNSKRLLFRIAACHLGTSEDASGRSKVCDVKFVTEVRLRTSFEGGWRCRYGDVDRHIDRSLGRRRFWCLNRSDSLASFEAEWQAIPGLRELTGQLRPVRVEL